MKSETLTLVTVTLAVAFVLVTQMRWGRFKRRVPWRTYGYPRLVQTDKPYADAGQQLNAVMAASFSKQRILSSREYRVFHLIEREVARQGRGCRVFAQANLGEILRSPSSEAYHSINSKRVDILLVDSGGWPILAVEYQGDGHYRGTAAARDAIKKEALRKAGVPYIEVSERDTEQQILERVREHLGLQTVAAKEENVSTSITQGVATVR